FPAVLSEKIPVHGAPAAKFLERPYGRRPPLAPSLKKSAARHCYNPTLDRAWRVFPLAEGSPVQGGAPRSLGKLVFPRRRGCRRSDAAEQVVQQHAADRPRLVRLPPYTRAYPRRPA